MTFGIEIFITEIIGIIAFAISGAIVGIKKHFDIFGIIVLGKGHVKNKKVNTEKLLTPQELDVKKAIDKLYNDYHKTDVDVNVANYDFSTKSTDENMAKLNELSEKNENFFKDEKKYEKFKNLSKNYKIKNEKLKENLNIVLKTFEQELGIKNTPTDADNSLNNVQLEVEMKANKFQPTKECDNYGDYIAGDLIKLVKARNAEAKKCGYENYYEMLLNANGMSSKELEPMFDKIIDSTKNAFDNYKSIPEDTEKLINSRIGKNNMTGVCDEIYKKMGWNVMDMPIGMDLFPRENKKTHNYCFLIDSNKDTRILANLSPDSGSINALLHELGHAVYNLGISDKLKMGDKKIASYALTEGVAMLMESLPAREGALEKILDLPAKTSKDLKENRISNLAAFARYQVHLARFEKAMYENPDQDLKKVWYEGMKKYYDYDIPPENEQKNVWAEIPHYITAPAYQQNYIKAEIIASQLYDAVTKHGTVKMTENPDTAKFFKNNVFRFGASKTEDEILKIATGKPLNVDAYCKQFEQ